MGHFDKLYCKSCDTKIDNYVDAALTHLLIHHRFFVRKDHKYRGEYRSSIYREWIDWAVMFEFRFNVAEQADIVNGSATLDFEVIEIVHDA